MVAGSRGDVQDQVLVGTNSTTTSSTGSLTPPYGRLSLAWPTWFKMGDIGWNP